MMNILKYLTVASLLAKKLLNQQSKEDEKKINDWLKEGNDETYKSIMALGANALVDVFKTNHWLVRMLDQSASIKSDLAKLSNEELRNIKLMVVPF